MAETKRLADVVYERLCDSIVDGALAPGQRIRDGELADRLGVSRMPVREALQRLERQGLIEMVASRFTRVTDITPDMPAKALEFLGYQLGIGFRLALPHMDQEQRGQAAELTRDVASAVQGDPKVAYTALSALTAYISTAGGNPVFSASVDDASLQLTRTLRGTFPAVKDAKTLSSEFTQLADRIAEGDAVGAEERIRDVFLLGAGQGGPAHAVADLWPEEADQPKAS